MRRFLPLLAAALLFAFPLRAEEPAFDSAEWARCCIQALPQAWFDALTRNQQADLFLSFADFLRAQGAPDTAADMTTIAANFLREGQSPTLAAAQAIHRRYPEAPPCRCTLARTLLLSRDDRAAEALALLQSIPPRARTAPVLDCLALAQLRTGRRSDALQTYLHLFDIWPEGLPPFCTLYDHFGDILYANDRLREAYIAWLQADEQYGRLTSAEQLEFQAYEGYDPRRVRAKIRAAHALLPPLDDAP